MHDLRFYQGTSNLLFVERKKDNLEKEQGKSELDDGCEQLGREGIKGRVPGEQIVEHELNLGKGTAPEKDPSQADQVEHKGYAEQAAYNGHFIGAQGSPAGHYRRDPAVDDQQ